MYVCMSVCSLNSETTCINFTKFPARVTCGSDSVHGRQCNTALCDILVKVAPHRNNLLTYSLAYLRYVLPVLWMACREKRSHKRAWRTSVIILLGSIFLSNLLMDQCSILVMTLYYVLYSTVYFRFLCFVMASVLSRHK